MEKRPARGWSPARRATMSTEAASCRWVGGSGNSFDGPRWKVPKTSGMRRSVRNATLARGENTNRRIASPATPLTRTRRVNRCAGSVIPSMGGRCSIATGKRRGGAAPATRYTETARTGNERKNHATDVTPPQGRSGRLHTLPWVRTHAGRAILSTGIPPRKTSARSSGRRSSGPISHACGAIGMGEKGRCLGG